MIQNMAKTRVVGVDISLERTSCGIVDLRGNIIATDGFPTFEHSQIGDYVAVLSDCIMRLIESNGGSDTIHAVGISAPSGNYLTNSIENSPNMPWKGVIPLAVMLRDRMGISVALANNAHMMALGEQAFGAAHGMRDFVIVTIGHGLGSCIVSNGQPHLGTDGFAGEIGHTCIRHEGRLCGCGNRGCLETYVAANGIVATAHEVMEESSEPSLMRQVEHLDPKVIKGFCDMGDQLAIETYRRTGYMLGLGLANYASILDPEAFVFTGGVSQAGKWLLEPAYESFNKHVFRNIENQVKFLPSGLENNVRNMLGASVLAWGIQEYSLFK